LSKTELRPVAASAARAQRIAELLDDIKVERIVVLDLREVTDLADFFVIAAVRSSAQMQGVAARVHETLKAEGLRPFVPVEGESSRWTILDYGDVVVHLFDEPTRELYQLEQVWGDAARYPWRDALTA
jgi:ribosome-associated protein